MKAQLRSEYKLRLKNWIQGENLDPSFLRIEQLEMHLESILKTRSGIWSFFLALPFEPHLELFSKRVSHITWALPKVVGSQLRFFVFDQNSKLHLSPMGIREPDEAKGKEVLVSELAGALIPGLAFDEVGGRLGRGKGFYDRALERFTGEKIGVGFEAQIADEPLPVDPWDIKMNCVVTESKVRVIPGSNERK